jgi:hypothetical protein
METKNPRSGQAAEALVSIRADAETSTKNHPFPQPLDDLRALRAMHLIQRFSLQPEAAAALALLVFGGGR